MTSFWSWVAGPGGTLALTIAALALGVVLGELDGVPRGRRRERVELRGRRVARQFRRMRPPELHHERVARYGQRLGQLHREYEAEHGHPAFAAGWTFKLPDYVAGSDAWLAQQEARWADEDQAMAVANGEDAAFLAGINERLDQWLADTFGTAP